MQEGVSVIIPVYNAEQYLNRCMESVVNQTHRQLEILLICDGATDGSDSLCRRWQLSDDRVVYVRKKNAGLGMTRNLGIQMAGYQYLTFLDSDDWLELNFVEKILNSLAETGAEIGMCDIKYCDSQTGMQTISKIRFNNRVVSVGENPSVINKARTFACGKIYHRKLFEEADCLFPEWTFEDIPCTPLLVSRANRIAYTPDTFYHYWRNRKNSLSNTPANISDIGRSLVLLQKRARKNWTDRRLDGEVKKLMVGQLRFAFKNWSYMGDSGVDRDLENLNGTVAMYYPSLKAFKDRKLCVRDDGLLRDAADCVVIDRDQLIETPEKADYVIGYEDDTCEGGAVFIPIPKDYGQWGDRGMAKWEIAERIMEKL